MSSLRSFGGRSLLKFSAQMASNWALFKDGSVAIWSESLSCTYSPLRPKGVRKEKEVAAQGIAQQLIADQTIQAIKPFAHIRRTRCKINPRRRAQAEHRL